MRKEGNKKRVKEEIVQEKNTDRWIDGKGERGCRRY